MANFFDQFKQRVITSVFKDEEPEESKEINNLIALGVLLWEVGEADDAFLPEEKDKISEVLQKYDDITDADMPIVLRAIEEASLEKIDLYTFTSEAGKDLSREGKIEIIENLFRVACIDNELDEKEHETIRKITNLFQLDHDEFINAKVRVKKEFGMDTAGL